MRRQGAHAAAVVSMFFASVEWACFGEAISEIEMPYGKDKLWNNVFLVLFVHQSCFATVEKHMNRYVSVQGPLFLRLKLQKSIELVRFQFNLL